MERFLPVPIKRRNFIFLTWILNVSLHWHTERREFKLFSNEIVGLLFREGKGQDLGKRDISTLSLFMKYIPEYAEYV